MILRPVAPPVEYGITKRLARAGNAAIAFLRSLGTSAHVWLPGANGTTVASLPSNNYLLSDGSTGYSTVDGVDGLDLDAMGATRTLLNQLSAFTLTAAGTTPPTAVNAADTFLGVPCVSATMPINAGGYAVCRAYGSGAVGTGAVHAIALGAYYNHTYSVALSRALTGAETVVFYTTGNTGTASFVTLNSSSAANTWIVGVTGCVCSGSGNNYPVAYAGTALTAPVTVYLRNYTVTEVTGTHLTQATTANKPLVRRGVLNELLNSATPATQSVTCIAAPYTLALYGTGNVVLSGTGAGTLTGTGASDLVVLNFTPTAGSVTFTKAGTVSSFGLFKGTWTAAQILAEGGIPTTTATAASSPSAGKYWWSFDGSNDSLLSGNLGITNACTIVIAGRVNSLPAINYLLGEAANGAAFYVNADGSVDFAKTAAGVKVVATAAGVIVAGVPFVITTRLSSGTAVIRKNGAQVATNATAHTFSATTGARIGTAFDGATLPLGGALGWVVLLPVALSDADCLTVERLVGSQFPGMATF